MRCGHRFQPCNCNGMVDSCGTAVVMGPFGGLGREFAGWLGRDGYTLALVARRAPSYWHLVPTCLRKSTRRLYFSAVCSYLYRYFRCLGGADENYHFSSAMRKGKMKIEGGNI
jgi:hypothetical protein